MTRLLMLEGNTLASQKQAKLLGVRTATEVYMHAISAHFPDIEMDVIHAEDRGQSMPHGRTFADYDGLVISGSGLHAYDTSFEVINQIEVLKSFAETGKPILGSCWGLQIAVIAAGGKVVKNPNGREIGFARKISLNTQGRAHPFMAGKPTVYDAPCIHYDEIGELPATATLLSSNAHSQVQAAIIPLGQSEVWAVQYHPEFDLLQMRMLLTLYEQNMYDQNFMADKDSFKSYTQKLDTLANNPDDKAMAWQLGIDTDITDDAIRRAELINWVRHVISFA